MVMYILMADDVNGYGLWKSDGTEAGTVFVKNLFRPGIYGRAAIQWSFVL